MERRLAAILAADVVGFSRLMAEDEADTLDRLIACEKEVIEPSVASQGGRIVKRMGDGYLVEFASIVAAVECAMAWQAAARDPILFRMGLHLGDVMVVDDDLYGDGVNVAARLEALAKPGSICLSDDAQRQVRGKIAADFADLGPQTLKNIPEPVRVFHLLSEGDEDPPAEPDRPQTVSGWPTLALLPFRHLGDPSQSYIAEGLTETLSAALALFEEFTFVGTPSEQDAPQPTFLLECSAQVSGPNARISMQLSEVATRRKVWGKSLDGETDGVFELQDEVVGIVASTMGEAILEEGARALQGKPRDSFRAYDWTLDGIQHLHRIDPEELRAARVSLEKALAMEPGLPLALIAIAWTYALELLNGWPSGRPDAYDYCLSLAKGLLKQNERYDQAHRLLARLFQFAGRHDEALEHSKRAYEINPYNSDMIVNYGLSLLYSGYAPEGVGHIEKGCRINPYAPAYYRAYLAFGYFLCGRFEDATSCLRGLERPIGSSRLFLAAGLAELGRQDEAEAEMRAHLAEHPEASLKVVANSIPLKEGRDRQAYFGALAKAGLPE